MKDYRTIAEDFHSGLSRLGKDIPQTIGGSTTKKAILVVHVGNRRA